MILRFYILKTLIEFIQSWILFEKQHIRWGVSFFDLIKTVFRDQFPSAPEYHHDKHV